MALTKQAMLALFSSTVVIPAATCFGQNIEHLFKEDLTKVDINVKNVNPLIWPGFATNIANVYTQKDNYLKYWWTDALQNGQAKYNSHQLFGRAKTWDWGWRWDSTRYAIEFEVPNYSRFSRMENRSSYTVIAFKNFVSVGAVYKANLRIYSTLDRQNMLPKFSQKRWTASDIETTVADPFNVHGDIQFFATGGPHGI